MGYSPELATLICERMAAGKSLREVCRAEDITVTETAVRLWAKEDKDGFASQYACAREAQMEAMADEILEIADDGTNDWMVRQRETKGVHYVENAEAINRSRLRVDSRKWLMSKILPKQYGDKLDHTVGGELTVVIQSSDADL